MGAFRITDTRRGRGLSLWPVGRILRKAMPHASTVLRARAHFSATSFTNVSKASCATSMRVFPPPALLPIDALRSMRMVKLLWNLVVTFWSKLASIVLFAPPRVSVTVKLTPSTAALVGADTADVLARLPWLVLLGLLWPRPESWWPQPPDGLLPCGRNRGALWSWNDGLGVGRHRQHSAPSITSRRGCAAPRRRE